MIYRLIAKIKLWLNPPQPGDIYFGDPFEHIIGKLIEKRLHKLNADDGQVLWEVVPSDDCYRITIEADSMPYYRCIGEALCVSTVDGKMEWKRRAQPRRILKEEFHDMIIKGALKKHGKY